MESSEEKQDYHSNSGADSLSWHPEAEVHAWLARRDSEREANGDGESSFSIGGCRINFLAINTN